MFHTLQRNGGHTMLNQIEGRRQVDRAANIALQSHPMSKSTSHVLLAPLSIGMRWGRQDEQATLPSMLDTWKQ